MFEMRTYSKTYGWKSIFLDDEDAPLVAPYRWHVVKSSRYAHTFYATAQIPADNKGGCTTLYMHKLLTGWTMTDHKDGNGLNNQSSNLRPVTGHSNQGNSRSVVGSSKYKGVSWRKDRATWRAYIMLPGKKYQTLGHYADEVEAARAYDRAARDHFGEFARLNFKEET